MQQKWIRERSTSLQQQIETLQDQLAGLPSGKLVCCQHRHATKWYHSDGHIKTYIPKSQRRQAEQLAAKKYLSLKIDELSRQKKALDFYLRHCPPDAPRAEELLEPGSAYAELLVPYFKPISQELEDWAAAPYPQNSKHPEHLLHPTMSGHVVRSKSEAMIDLFLFTNRIPFRYECQLDLGEAILYPDFTIRHPITGDEYYWEHFGMMDDPVYAKHAAAKLQTYVSQGILPSQHLITTYETRKHPLTAETVQRIIAGYFL